MSATLENIIASSGTLTLTGNVSNNGLVTFTNTQESNGIGSGAVVLSGGLSVSKNVRSNGAFVQGSNSIVINNLGIALNSPSIASTSNSTGALLLTGGIGISNTTDATSATNGGTITTAGGIGIAKSLYLGGLLSVSKSVTQSPNPVTNGNTATYSSYGISGVANVNVNGLTVGSIYTFTITNTFVNTTSSVVIISSNHDSFITGISVSNGSFLMAVRNVGSSTGAGPVTFSYLILN